MVERKRGSRERYDSDDERDDRDRNETKRRRAGTIIKLLCPYYIAGAVIGKGGEKIREVKDRSGATIEISRHESRFPGTDERVIALEGDRDELQAACRYLSESMRDGDSGSSRHTDYDSDRRRRSCKILVADSSMAMIIGRGGDNIRDIKKEFCVQINTSKRSETPISLDERVITIEGEDRDVDRCVDELICLICTDDRSKMRFSVEYFEHRHFSRGGGGGPSRYRQDRNRSRSRSRDRRSRSRSRRRATRSPSNDRRYSRKRSRTPKSPSRSRSR